MNKQEWYIFFVFMILYMLYRNTQKHTLMMLSGPSFHFYFFVSGLKCKWSLRRLECRACFLLTSEMEFVSLGLPRLSIGFAWVAWPGFFTMTMTETYVYNIYTGICQVESRCELFDGSVLFCQSRSGGGLWPRLLSVPFLIRSSGISQPSRLGLWPPSVGQLSADVYVWFINIYISEPSRLGCCEPPLWASWVLLHLLKSRFKLTRDRL